MREIQQGDQYSIPVKIKVKNGIVTPEVVDDVRIKIRDVMKTYEDGQLTFDSTQQTWLYPISEVESRKLKDNVAVQVGIKIVDKYIYSPTKYIYVGRNIIKEDWNEQLNG